MYVTLLIQLMIWSGFILIEWLSGNDRLLFKVLMFVVFFYLAFLIGKKIVCSTKLAIAITFFSLCIHFIFYYQTNVFP